MSLLDDMDATRFNLLIKPQSRRIFAWIGFTDQLCSATDFGQNSGTDRSLQIDGGIITLRAQFAASCRYGLARSPGKWRTFPPLQIYKMDGVDQRLLGSSSCANLLRTAAGEKWSPT